MTRAMLKWKMRIIPWLSAIFLWTTVQPAYAKAQPPRRAVRAAAAPAPKPVPSPADTSGPVGSWNIVAKGSALLLADAERA